MKSMPFDGGNALPERIVELCAAFSAACATGRLPSLENYIRQVPAGLREQAVRELLRIELRLRADRGETPSPKEYQTRYPEFSHVISRLFDSQGDASLQPTTSWSSLDSETIGGIDDLANTPPSLGRFQIKHLLGQGSYGTVYCAYDPTLDRDVALKLPRAGQLQSPEAVQRFLREARAAAQLRHPHIVSIHEAGEIDSVQYIAASFVSGQTLRATLRSQQERYTQKEAASLIRKIADALDYAHRCRIVHRDIKPENIMIDAEGQPQIMDFGLARREDTSLQTHEGVRMGTPAYMSPEQARGESRTADGRSDLWSIGVILYELLTGERPFQARDHQLIDAILNQEPKAPRKVDPTISRDLETICQKCLAKDREHRFATCGELVAELDRCLRGEPIVSRPIGAIERTVRWSRRNPVTAGLLSAVATTLLIGFVSSALLWLEARHQAEIAQGNEKSANEQAALAIAKGQEAVANAAAAEKARKRANEQAELALQRERSARWSAYVPSVREASKQATSGFVGQALDRLRAQVPAPEQEDLRGPEWYLIWKACHGESQLFREHKGPVYDVGVSPDGKTIASAGDDHKVILWDIDTSQQRGTLNGHTSAVRSVAFSPDGKQIATGGDDFHIRIWDAETTDVVHTFLAGERSILHVEFSPDGQWLAAIADGANTLRLWSTQTWKLYFERESKNGIWAFAFSPDSQTIATTGWGDHVELWDIHLGQNVQWLDDYGIALSYAPDGSALYVAGSFEGARNWKIRRHDLTTYDARLELHNSFAIPLDMAISPQGNFAALCGGSEASLSRLQIFDLQSRRVIATLPGHRESVNAVAFTPDGQWLVSGSDDSTVRLWSLDEFLNKAQGNLHNGTIYDLAFAPDGKHFATASADFHVHICDASTGEIVKSLRHEHAVVAVAYSPDGNLLATGTSRGGRTLSWYDTHTWECVYKSERPDYVLSVAFSPDGKFIANGLQGAVEIWDLATKKLLRNPTVNNTWIHGIAFSHDGALLATASSDNTSAIVEVRTGKVIRRLRGHWKSVYDVAFSPDDQRIATSALDGTWRLWNAGDGTEISSHSQDGGGYSIAFSRDGTLIATGTNHAAGGCARLWDANAPDKAHKLTGHSDIVLAVEFSPDGKTLLSASQDGVVVVWDVNSRRQRKRLENRRDTWSVAISPQDDLLAVGGRNDLRMIDAHSGDEIRRLDMGNEDPFAHNHSVNAVTFSPDGSLVVAADGNQFNSYGKARVHVWNARDGQHVADLAVEHLITDVAFSPDGKILALAPQGGERQLKDVELWSVDSWERTHRLTHPNVQGIRCLAFSPDGRTLATCSDEWVKDRKASITLWDVASTQRLMKLEVDAKAIAGIIFHDQGRMLISAGYGDTQVHLWDLTTGERMGSWPITSEIRTLTELPGTERIAIACGDQTVRIWETTSWQELASLDTRTVDGWVHEMASSSGGRSLYAAKGSHTNGGGLWMLQQADPQAEELLAASSEVVSAVPPNEETSAAVHLLERALREGSLDVWHFQQCRRVLLVADAALDAQELDQRDLVRQAIAGLLSWAELADQIDKVPSLERRQSQRYRELDTLLRQQRTERAAALATQAAESIANGQRNEADQLIQQGLRVHNKSEQVLRIAEELRSQFPRKSITNFLEMELVEVFPGRFMMGSPVTQGGRGEDEPFHGVNIDQPLFVATCEVTRGQFASFVAATDYKTDAEKGQPVKAISSQGSAVIETGLSWKNPGFEQTDEHPVVCVSWNDAKAFCRWLSDTEKRNYRLPSEAEWEYFCRAGESTAFAWGDEAAAGDRWCNAADQTFLGKFAQGQVFRWDDAVLHTAPAGTYQANDWGIYDAHGNVSEWCFDRWQHSHPRTFREQKLGVDNWNERVVRGGSWQSSPPNTRCAFRMYAAAISSATDLGFRVVSDGG